MNSNVIGSRAITKNWQKIQCSTFTNWINERLKLNLQETSGREPIRDLVLALNDGLLLVELAECLEEGKKVKGYTAKPRVEAQKLDNLAAALQFIKDQGIKFVNIGPEDIYHGNTKLVFGLVWTLIQRYQIGIRNQRISTKGILTVWSQAMLPDLPITNLTSDWNDGQALCGLVENLCPGLCPDYLDLDPQDKLENVKMGMHLAETHLGVPSLIEPEDFVDPNIDEMSVMTYLSYFVSPAKAQLLKWVKQVIPEFDITNFSTDWSDGIALATLTHRLFDQLCPDCGSLKSENGLENLRYVIEEAEYRLGVTKLLTLEEMMDPNVDEMSMITFLAQFKTATLLPLAGECACSGTGLKQAIVGKMSRFKIDGSRAGNLETLVVKLEGPSGDNAIAISPFSPGVFSASYCCQEVGEYSVIVTLNGQAVKGSPFRVNSFDPRKCEIIHRPSYIAQGQQATIVVDHSRAGKGVLQARLGDEKEGTVEVLDNNDGTVTVLVTQQTGSEVKLELLFNNELIPNCSATVFPLVDTAKEASKGRLMGNGVHTAIATQKSEITLTGLSVGLLEREALAISVTGITSEAETELYENENGTYTVEYIPPKPGAYIIQVHCYGLRIPGSPFKLNVLTKPDASKCVFLTDKTKYKISGHELVFKVDTKEAGTGTLAAAILSEKHNVFKIPCEHKDDGRYVLRFTPNDGKCRYVLHVRWSRVPIPGTPYRFRVWPAADASKCFAYGPGLNEGVVNEPCEFHIDAREAGIGSLSVRVHGVKDAFKVKVEYGKPDPRVMTATYTSQEAGEYIISVRWSSVDIPGSPFGVYITNPAAELEAQMKKERMKQKAEERAIKSEERRQKFEEANETRRKNIEELKRRSEERRRLRQKQEEERQAAIKEMQETLGVRTRQSTPGHYSKDSLQQYWFMGTSPHSSPAYYQYKPISTRHRSSSFRIKKDAKQKRKTKSKRTAHKDNSESQGGDKPPAEPLKYSYKQGAAGSMGDMFGLGFSGRNLLTGKKTEMSFSSKKI
jgi:filamin